MGMWEGLYLGMQGIREREEREMDREEARRIREEDMAFRREQINQARIDSYRQAVLPILLARREEDKVIRQTINSGVSLGFDRPVAEALYRAGQLGNILEQAKANEYSPEQISAVNAEVTRQLGDMADSNTVAATLLGVFESGADLNDPEQTTLAIVESVFNTQNIEDLQDLYVGSAYSERLPRFDISLSTTQMDLDLEKKVRDGIMRRLQGTFGPNTIVSTETGFSFAANAPVALTGMVNSLTDAAVDRINTPGGDRMDEVTAIRYFTNPVMQAYQTTPNVDLVNQNLSTLFESGPDEFIRILSTIESPTIPVPSDNPVGDALTAMTGGTQQREEDEEESSSSFAPGVFR
jgi:hypothetical protein